MINHVITWCKNNFSSILFFLIIVLVIILVLSFGFFFYADTNSKLEFLGNLIGIPTSILITAFFSSYEFKQEQRYKDIRIISDYLYKIIFNLLNIRREAGPLAGLYIKSMPNKILDSQLGSIMTLTKLPDINAVEANFNSFKEYIHVDKSLYSKFNNKVKRIENLLKNMLNELDYISNYNHVNIKTKRKYIQNIHNGCTIIDIDSLKLITSFKSIQNNISN